MARPDRRDSTVCQAAADAAGEGRGPHIVVIAAAGAPAAVSHKANYVCCSDPGSCQGLQQLLKALIAVIGVVWRSG